MSGQPFFLVEFYGCLSHTVGWAANYPHDCALERKENADERILPNFFVKGAQAWMLGRLDCFIALNVLNLHSTCFVLEKKKLRFLASHFQVSAKQQPVPDIQRSLQRPAQFKEAVSATHAWVQKFPSSNSCTQFNLKADLFIGCLAAWRTQQREDIKPCLFL